MTSGVLVLDANILIRAVLGNKVRDLIITHSDTVCFFTPDVCMEDSKKYLPVLLEKRKLPSVSVLELLSHLEQVVKVVDEEVYKGFQKEACQRMAIRDIRDWPIVATALTFNCPIWTEDQDFFGSGVSTWTTDRIHIFFNL
jgi:predicted nucleic acid-binding protein